MFESATFESMGVIHTRSRRWMGAVLCFEFSLLLMMVLIPLLHPLALTRFKNITFVDPYVPVPQTPPHPVAHSATASTEMAHGVVFMPTQIPDHILYVDGPEPAVDTSIVTWASNPAANGTNPFGNHPAATTVRPAISGPIRVSSTFAESVALYKTPPVYPPIARATHTEGTVRLAATISKTGSIENLRVTSGPVLLQQAALNAVSCWRYKPYLLDGQPVEVETTVDVIFTLSR
ncbi:MAG: TonB family protein [Terracidiphilus sp.]